MFECLSNTQMTNGHVSNVLYSYDVHGTVYLGFRGQVQEIWDTAASAEGKENKINVAFMEAMDPLNPSTVTTYDLWMIESILKRHLTQYLIVNVVSTSSSAILDFGCSSDTVSG